MNNIGEQHRHLLVLRRSSGVCERCTALVAELGVGWRFGAARPTEQPRRGQSTATIPDGVHVSIVSPLLGDVRHIAVASPTLISANVTLMGSAGSLHVYFCQCPNVTLMGSAGSLHVYF